MALDSTEKAPPAKGEPATTTATVDAAHPAPVPVPADLPSHQARARGHLWTSLQGSGLL